MKRIKVLYVVFRLDIGGAETVVINYLRNLYNDENFEVALLVLSNPIGTAFEKEVLEKGFNVHFLHLKHPKISKIFGMNSLKRLWPVYRIIKEYNPDIVHTHETANIVFSLFPIYLNKVPVRIHTLHGNPLCYDEFTKSIAKIAFNKFRYFPVCITEEQAEKARKTYGFKDYKLIHNGIDYSKYKLDEGKVSIRKSLGYTENDFVVGFVGRLAEIKNIDFALKVFNELLHSVPNAKLLIVGEGDERSKLECIVDGFGITNKVKFMGFRSDVPRMLKAMDVFILTSFSEASPIVFVEAQLSGLQCVVSTAVPASIVFTENVNILSLDESTNKWVDAIMGKLPNVPIKCSLDDFSMEKFIADTKQLYTDLLQKHS